MSWHGVHRPDQLDPFAKPEPIGKRFGCFEVFCPAEPDAHYGLRAHVRCVECGHKEIRVLAQLRHNPPKRHRGCQRTPRAKDQGK
jgi:hypothetical protein